MEDEKYVYLQDIKEKKSTGRSAHNRRTHAGKGGAVRFPSDFMTRKEKNAMNGEVKSYKLNSPMDWGQFKKLPDDLQKIYVKLLRDRFRVPDFIMAEEMFKITKTSLSRAFRDMGLGEGGAGAKTKMNFFKREEWEAWLHGEDVPVTVENPDPEPVATEEPEAEEQIAPPVYTTTVPASGEMTFIGDMTQALHTALLLLEGAKGKITISWEVDNDG